MKDKLIHFLATYGNDFFSKLHRYKTAKYRGKYIKLFKYNSLKLTFLIDNPDYSKKVYQTVDLFDLDDFVL